MRSIDVITTALEQIRVNKLRSFFTLLGIIVSVAFLVAVVAIISGMNAYVKENLASALIGANTFQVRRTPIRIGLFDDEEWKRLQRRPRITEADADAVIAAVPEAVAISMQSGWPTPIADIVWRDKTQADVAILGVTAPYQVVQDYVFDNGRPISDIDVRVFTAAPPVQRDRVRIVGCDGKPVHWSIGSRTVAEKRNGSWEMTPISRRREVSVTSRTSTPSSVTRPELTS